MYLWYECNIFVLKYISMLRNGQKMYLWYVCNIFVFVIAYQSKFEILEIIKILVQISMLWYR